MLADEEFKHYRTVERMKTETPEAVKETPVLANAKEVFEKMRGSAEKFGFDISEVDLYRKACDIEAESKAFYLEKADAAEDADQERVFRRLAEEENKHLFLVQQICDFVSRPETYLEDAEFYHFDDYVEGQF
jgi:rubrerythrin